MPGMVLLFSAACVLPLGSTQLPVLSLRGAKRRGNPYSYHAGSCGRQNARVSADRSRCAARQGTAEIGAIVLPSGSGGFAVWVSSLV
jgi:hypothetical protein